MDNKTLIRDVVVFQFKLIVDGLRDFALVPVSLLAGLLSLLFGKDGKPGSLFYEVLSVGKNSEHWIDLFGALRNAPDDVGHTLRFPQANIDEILGNIETFVIDEEKRGGMTAQARQRFEQALRGFHDRRDAHAPGRADRDEPAS
ncbi:MAG: hypothetical protein MJA32_12375 [Proteobacteria bacterium]|nr:hypothetical protein [Pseudomonadota bacterium]